MKHVRLDGANLSEVHLGSADLTEASLTNVNMQKTNAVGVECYGAIFTNSNLEGTNFSWSKMRKVVLDGTNLKEATFQHTELPYASFRGANLTGVEFGRSVMTGVNLSGATGLDSIKFSEPNAIDLETIRLSGELPLTFLRGCGLPEPFITYLPSLNTAAQSNPLLFYDCFISYAEVDDLFSERLYNDLQGASVRCWRWKEDATIGRPLMKEIDGAIQIYDKLIVICSEASLKSPAVNREIERALQKEDEHMRQGKDPDVLVPIRLDNYIFDKWEHHRKADVITKMIGDFQKWKDPVHYKTAFKQFLEDLRSPRSGNNS
ncbi:MAG: toll/interleukin-1 receptor domain-containing protein [Nitrospirales bacterium]